VTVALSHLLDTSVFSQPIKDKPVRSVLDRWSALPEDTLCTSSVCLAEVLGALHDRESPKYWRRYRELLENQYAVLPFDAAAADVFSRLDVALRRKGKPRPTLDLMIAATACRHDLVLATLNPRDFTDIPGLAVEDWSRHAAGT
jgi:predicted nucleic acid-binding protein